MNNNLISSIMTNANAYLDKCEIYGSAEDRKGVQKNIEMSIEAKANLWDIFKKSPYHNGKGQLVFPTEIRIPIDENAIDEFANYLEKLAEKLYLVQLTAPNGWTYSQLLEEVSGMEKVEQAARYLDAYGTDLVVRGKTYDDYEEELTELRKFKGNIQATGYSYYDRYSCETLYCSRENGELLDKVRILADIIRGTVGVYLEDEYLIEKGANAFPNAQIKSGRKITKVVNKALDTIGFLAKVSEDENLLHEFRRKYAWYCDAINIRSYTRWTILSINPVDFLTISFGWKWTSCLNTDGYGHAGTCGMYYRGFNSRRTLDYMLDPSTMVFYTIDYNYEGNDFELEPKLTRQLFHFDGNKLIQARLYPQDNISRRDTYTIYRNAVQTVLAQAMGEANLWSSPVRGTMSDGDIFYTPYDDSDNGDYIDFSYGACHGGDERDFQSEVNYTYLKGEDNRDMDWHAMRIGATNAVDIMTAEQFSEYYHDGITMHKNEY